MKQEYILLNNLEGKQSQTNLTSLRQISKETISPNNSTKTAAWKLVPDPSVFFKN